MRFQEVCFSDFLKVLFTFWNHEKDRTIDPALSKSLTPYGMKCPVGENGLYPTTTEDTVTSNDGILCFAFEYNTLIWNDSILSPYLRVTLTAVKGHFIRKIELET